MLIHSLGHTECLVEIPTESKTIRILLDGWLSDYSVSDLMERSPKIEIDWKSFPKLDVVYISHSHFDHLDPYFLSELFKHQSPVLLLAETLSYLVPVLKEYLPTAKIDTLKQLRPYEIGGAKITWLVFENEEVGNEEDVMSLFIEHGSSCAYFEIDTLPPENPEEQEKLYSLFNKKPYKSRLYVASRNELEGNLSILDLDPTKRKNYEKQYRETRKEWIEWQYEKFESLEVEYRDVRDLSGFALAIIGQGMQCPVRISPDLAAAKILPLDEIAEIERSTARRYKKKFDVYALSGWKAIEVDDSGIQKADSMAIPGLRIGKQVPRNLNHSASLERLDLPLSSDKADFSVQETAILRALNEKFLPTKLADPFDNLKNAILRNSDKTYRIEVRYWAESPFESRYYVWNFGMSSFEREISDKATPRTDERYFANDLYDFLIGKQELYCNFLHKLDPKMPYRFWTVLGNTFLNNDLVIKKLAFHFERAKKWLTAESFVMGFYDGNVRAR